MAELKWDKASQRDEPIFNPYGDIDVLDWWLKRELNGGAYSNILSRNHLPEADNSKYNPVDLVNELTSKGQMSKEEYDALLGRAIEAYELYRQERDPDTTTIITTTTNNNTGFKTTDEDEIKFLDDEILSALDYLDTLRENRDVSLGAIDEQEKSQRNKEKQTQKSLKQTYKNSSKVNIANRSDDFLQSANDIARALISQQSKLGANGVSSGASIYDTLRELASQKQSMAVNKANKQYYNDQVKADTDYNINKQTTLFTLQNALDDLNKLRNDVRGDYTNKASSIWQTIINAKNKGGNAYSGDAVADSKKDFNDNKNIKYKQNYKGGVPSYKQKNQGAYSKQSKVVFQ